MFDITQYLPNLLGTGLVATLLVSVGKQLLKSVSDRYGALVTQILLLVVSFLVAGGAMLVNLLPAEILATTLSVAATAMFIYEVLYKALWQNAIKGQ